MGHPYLDHPGVIAFAHRGGTSDWPENTLPAFQAAVDLGYRYLETDVHASADGVLFAFHDEHLGRVTDVNCLISELDADELEKVVVEGRAGVPRLEELLVTWPDARFNIDPKSDGAVLPLVRALRNHDALDRVCIGSFSDRRIAFCRSELGPRLCTSMGPREVTRLRLASLGFPSSQRFEADCAQLPTGFRRWQLVDRRLLEAAHDRAIDVHVWTIDEPDEMGRLIDLGVDGLMTDRPRVLRDVLARRGLWEDCTDE